MKDKLIELIKEKIDNASMKELDEVLFFLQEQERKHQKGG